MNDIFNLEDDIFQSDKIQRLKMEEKNKKDKISIFNKFYKKCKYTDLLESNELTDYVINSQIIRFNLLKDKDKLLYCIYIITSNNNVIYVGATSHLKNRIQTHIRSIRIAYSRIHKYINNNLLTDIKFDIIDADIEYNDIEFWETHYINLYRSYGFNLMNVSNIGGGGIIR
jgi:hypothetical protein